MRWAATAKLRGYVVLVVVGLVAGFAMGRPEPVVLVAPLAVVAVTGLAAARPPRFGVTVAVEPARVAEGESITVSVDVLAHEAVPQLEVLVPARPGLTVEAGQRLRGIALRAGERRRVAVTVRATRWGTYDLGAVHFRARDRFGLLVAEAAVARTERVIVHPAPEVLRRLIRPRWAQTAPGNQLARTRGIGVEFADLRPFVTGDRMREVNWRATARRGTVWVNERHPDRTTDVVLFLDAFSGTALEVGVRAADALATAYLQNRDRVGMVTFGGVLRWVRPGMGLRQQYVVVDTLLATQPFPSVADKEIALLPPRVLPPKALVVAVTPLEDERILAALVDLRDRGIDLVVVEVSQSAPAAGSTAELAERLWRLRRAVLRDRYRSLGVPVVEWTDGQPLAAVIEEVRLWPRSPRLIG